MADETAEKGKYPYLPFQTFMSLITKMEKEGIPARIDRGYLNYTSGTNQIYLPMALRSFGLLNDDNSATEELTALVKNTADRKKLLGQLVKRHYSKQVALPQNATAQMLEETFAPLQGETKRKAVTFFLHAAKEAELPLSKHFKAPKAAKSATGTRRTRRTPAGKPQEQTPPPSNQPTPPAHGGMTRSLELKSGGTLTVSLTANIWDLSEDDERFVMGLVKTMRSYGEAKSLPPGDGDFKGGQI